MRRGWSRKAECTDLAIAPIHGIDEPVCRSEVALMFGIARADVSLDARFVLTGSRCDAGSKSPRIVDSG